MPTIRAAEAPFPTLSHANTSRLSAAMESAQHCLQPSEEPSADVDVLEIEGAQALAGALSPPSREDARGFLIDARSILHEALKLHSKEPSKQTSRKLEELLESSASCIHRSTLTVAEEPLAPPDLAGRLRACVVQSAASGLKGGPEHLSIDPRQVASAVAHVDRAIALLESTHLGATCRAFVKAAHGSIEKAVELLPEAQRRRTFKSKDLPQVQLALECSHAHSRLEVFLDEASRLRASAALIDDAQTAARIMADAAKCAATGQARSIRTADVKTSALLVKNLVNLLDGQPPSDAAICQWPGVESAGGEPAAPASADAARKHLKLALGPDRTNRQRLDHLRDFAIEAQALSVKDAISVLEKIPRGEDWGYKKPDTVPHYKALMKAHGLGDWNTDDFEYLDLQIVAHLLEKLPPLTPSEAKRIERLALRVVGSSKGLERKKEAYVADCKTLVRVLVNAARADLTPGGVRRR